MRAGSVAVAGHALDCAECAGMRRMRWNAPNALECAVCAELRQLRRIAPFAPNCADCALFAPNCADCAGIALEFCLQPGTQPYTHGWRSLVATSLLAACSFRAVPVVPALSISHRENRDSHGNFQRNATYGYFPAKPQA